jgi:hypothetical protein
MLTRRSTRRLKLPVTALLTLVTGLVTGRTSPINRTRCSRQALVRGECGARGRICNPLPGGFGHQPLGTMTGARGAIAGLGSAGAGNTRLANAATSQEAWPEVASKTTKVPLARAAVERRQSWAPRKGRGRARRHGIITFASVGVSPPIFYFVLSRSFLFLSSLPGLTRQSMPKRGFGSAPTGVCQRRSSINHRIKSGGDE